MKNLVIVESPSKSKTIEKYLGKDFEVVSSKGHIRDLATSGKDGLGVDVENEFTPKYIISKGKNETVKSLKEKAAKADYVYLATDPDREGEAISWHLAEELGVDMADENRVVFNEITHDAVIEAFKHPRCIDIDLVKSQETRRILDRIIGFKLSKLLNKKIKSKSAGRVQSVALKLIVEKEKEINAFIPEEYWNIDLEFNENKTKFTAGLSKVDGKKADIKTEDECNNVLKRIEGELQLIDIKTSVRKREPKLPFITSTLQQEASTKLSFSAKRTMSIAQGLYEGVDVGNGSEGLITYMRTDSTRLSEVFVNSAKKYINDEYGKKYVGKYKVKNDSNSQDAHEAIRPTNLNNTPEKIKDHLTNDQYKLYKMIYARALASLMAASTFNTVTYTFAKDNVEFVSNGATMTFDGYLKVYGDYESSKDVLLPELVLNNMYTPEKVIPSQHFTEPPLRYSEARLIKEMEELGIGRPSTYATIIDTIQAREYVELKKPTQTSKTKVFYPTEQGTLTTEKLDEFFNSIINVKYTAQMEMELDEIANGDMNNIKALQAFWDKFIPLVDAADDNMEKIAPEPVGEVCPECGKELIYRKGRFGKFIACSGFPNCKYSRNIVVKEKKEAVYVEKDCPLCGKKLVKRQSRFRKSEFVGCSGYPSCHYMETLEGEVIEMKPKATTKKTTKKTSKRGKK